jgi:hypothetical protein
LDHRLLQNLLNIVFDLHEFFHDTVDGRLNLKSYYLLNLNFYQFLYLLCHWNNTFHCQLSRYLLSNLNWFLHNLFYFDDSINHSLDRDESLHESIYNYFLFHHLRDHPIHEHNFLLDDGYLHHSLHFHNFLDFDDALHNSLDNLRHLHNSLDDSWHHNYLLNDALYLDHLGNLHKFLDDLLHDYSLLSNSFVD